MSDINKDRTKNTWAYFKRTVKLLVPGLLISALLSDYIISLIPLEPFLQTDTSFEVVRSFFMSLLILGLFFIIKANLLAVVLVLDLLLTKNIHENTEYTPSQLWMLTLKKLPQIFILMSMLSAIIYLGLLALLVPAYILGLRFSFAWFYLIYEDFSPVSALRLSFQKTKRRYEYLTHSAFKFLVFFFLIVVFLMILNLFIGSSIFSLFISIFASFCIVLIHRDFFKNFVKYGHEEENNE